MGHYKIECFLNLNRIGFVYYGDIHNHIYNTVKYRLNVFRLSERTY